MKKDIVIPEVKNVHIIAIYEWNNDIEANTWFVYLLNTLDTPIEMVMIVSKAQGVIDNEERVTSALRHSYKEVSPFTAVRIEMLTTNVLELENIFNVSYFIGNQMFDKKFVFPTQSIQEKNQVPVEALMTKGIFAS